MDSLKIRGFYVDICIRELNDFINALYASGDDLMLVKFNLEFLLFSAWNHENDNKRDLGEYLYFLLNT